MHLFYGNDLGADSRPGNRNNPNNRPPRLPDAAKATCYACDLPVLEWSIENHVTMSAKNATHAIIYVASQFASGPRSPRLLGRKKTGLRLTLCLRSGEGEGASSWEERVKHFDDRVRQIRLVQQLDLYKVGREKVRPPRDHDTRKGENARPDRPFLLRSRTPPKTVERRRGEASESSPSIRQMADRETTASQDATHNV